MSAPAVHPHVATMRRYVEDYTNRHDLAVAREIMHPEYRFTMGGRTLGLDAYLEMVEWAFGRFPDLWLSATRLVSDGERLAMSFREFATSPRHGRHGSWPGVALYRFHSDGRLHAASVEQDFWGRLAQLEGRRPAEPISFTDSSVWSPPIGPASVERAAVEGSLRSSDTWDRLRFDDEPTPPFDIVGVQVVDIIAAVDGVAARIDLDARFPGRRPVRLAATGICDIDDRGGVTVGHFVTDRHGTLDKLTDR